MKENNEIYIKICPKCGSTNITPYSKMGLNQGEFFIEYCKDCYYSGNFFPEVKKSMVEEFRMELNKQQKET